MEVKNDDFKQEMLVFQTIVTALANTVIICYSNWVLCNV